MSSKILPIILAVLVVVSLAGAGYFYNEYSKAQKEIQSIKTDPSNVQRAAQEEAKKLIDEVGKLIDLPIGEEPTVATISDIEKLKDQPFFEKGKNGDKVLIYTNAKKAILYDPKTKKVIDVAPVNIGTSSAAQANPSAAPIAYKVALRNGTNTVGLTNQTEPKVKEALPGATVVSKENASKQDYDRTIVVALKEEAKPAAESLAKAIKGGVESIPAGEESPKDADILVILGKAK